MCDCIKCREFLSKPLEARVRYSNIAFRCRWNCAFNAEIIMHEVVNKQHKYKLCLSNALDSTNILSSFIHLTICSSAWFLWRTFTLITKCKYSLITKRKKLCLIISETWFRLQQTRSKIQVISESETFTVADARGPWGPRNYNIFRAWYLLCLRIMFDKTTHTSQMSF